VVNGDLNVIIGIQVVGTKYQRTWNPIPEVAHDRFEKRDLERLADIVDAEPLPGALPGFLVGLRFSLAYSVLGLVAAETVNANQGLGFLVTQAQTYLQTNQVFVGLVIYSILGLLADQVVRILERVLLRWRPSYEAT